MNQPQQNHDDLGKTFSSISSFHDKIYIKTLEINKETK